MQGDMNPNSKIDGFIVVQSTRVEVAAGVQVVVWDVHIL